MLSPDQLRYEINEESRRICRQWAANPARACELGEFRNRVRLFQASLVSPVRRHVELCGWLATHQLSREAWLAELRDLGFRVGPRSAGSSRVLFNLNAGGVSVRFGSDLKITYRVGLWLVRYAS